MWYIAVLHGVGIAISLSGNGECDVAMLAFTSSNTTAIRRVHGGYIMSVGERGLGVRPHGWLAMEASVGRYECDGDTALPITEPYSLSISSLDHV